LSLIENSKGKKSSFYLTFEELLTIKPIIILNFEKRATMTIQENHNFTEDLSQELNLFLSLASGELKISMREANVVVQKLTATFMEMVNDVHNIKIAAERLDVNDKKNMSLKTEISSLCNNYLNKVEAGTVGFQFYDKMTQRLQHTSGNINRLMLMAERPDSLLDHNSWQQLKEKIEKSYNMEEDRALFQALMKGDSIQNAIKLATDIQEKQTEKDKVELF